MTNISNIQQEFENLISELGRLKTINELTSSNTNAAKQIIDEFETFASFVHNFKELVKQDFEQKSGALADLLSRLNESWQTLEKNSKKHFAQTEENLAKLTAETGNNLNKNNEIIVKEINSFVQQFSAIEKNLVNELSQKSESYNENLSQTAELLIAQIKQVEGTLLKQKEELSILFRSFEKSGQENLQAVENKIIAVEELNRKTMWMVVGVGILSFAGLLISLLK